MPKVKKSIPLFLVQARSFYAEAFAHRRKADLRDAMSEWADLDETEQSFAVAHLAYLDLEAQAVTQQLLSQVRDLLDELAEAFTIAVEPAPVEEQEEDDGPTLMDLPPAALPTPDVIDNAPAEGTP